MEVKEVGYFKRCKVRYLQKAFTNALSATQPDLVVFIDDLPGANLSQGGSDRVFPLDAVKNVSRTQPTASQYIFVGKPGESRHHLSDVPTLRTLRILEVRWEELEFPVQFFNPTRPDPVFSKLRSSVCSPQLSALNTGDRKQTGRS